MKRIEVLEHALVNDLVSKFFTVNTLINGDVLTVEIVSTHGNSDFVSQEQIQIIIDYCKLFGFRFNIVANNESSENGDKTTIKFEITRRK